MTTGASEPTESISAPTDGTPRTLAPHEKRVSGPRLVLIMLLLLVVIAVLIALSMLLVTDGPTPP